MGKLIGALTNQSITDPQSGQTTYGNPQQILDKLNSMPMPGSPSLVGSPTQAPPTIQQPTYQQAVKQGAPPGGENALSPGLTKAGKLVTMLTSGLQGAMAGRAAQENMIAATGGRRAGGVGTGFMAGLQEPLQHATQQAQLQLLQSQSQMVPTPYGQMPLGFARYMFPSMIRGQTQEDIQSKKSSTAETIADKNIASREGIAARNLESREKLGRYQAIPGVGLFDKQTQTIQPGTQQGVTITSDLAQQYGLPPEYVGKPMTLTNLATLENVQTSRAPKVTSGESVQTDAQGNIIKVPTTHVTTPMIPQPGGGTKLTPSLATGGVPRQPGTGGVKPVLDAQGNPIKSQGGATKGAKWVSWDENGRTVAGPMSMAVQRGADNYAEVPAQEVRDITNARHAVGLMTKVGDPNKPETQGTLQLLESLDKEGKLGLLASRWNRFMTSGVGASPDDDPRIVTLLNKNMLGDTATMLAHFGASGGRSPQMLQHFMDLANAGKMDGVTLRAGVKAMADYMTDRAQIPSKNFTKPQTGGPPAGATHAVYVGGKIVGYTSDGKTMIPAGQ